MKRVLQLMVLLVLIVMMQVFPTMAECQSDAERTEELEFFQIVTDGWNDCFYKGQAEVCSVTPVVDFQDTVTGFSVSFSVFGKNAGYLVLSFIEDDDQPVVMYSLDGMGLYECLESQDKRFISSEDNVTIPKKLITDSMINYYLEIKTEKEKLFFSNSSVIQADSNTTDLKTNTFAEDMLDKKQYPIVKFLEYNADKKTILRSGLWNDAFVNSISGTAIEYRVLPGAFSFEPKKMTEYPAYSNPSLNAGAFNENNCGPTALTNLIKYYVEKRGKSVLLLNNDLRQTYTKISQLSGYTPTNSMFFTGIGSLSQYGSFVNYPITPAVFVLNTWDVYKTNLDNNHGIIILVRGDDSSGNVIGHYAFVLGYTKLSNGAQYLRICNGWDNSPNRFIKFRPSCLSFFGGYCIKIY